MVCHDFSEKRHTWMSTMWMISPSVQQKIVYVPNLAEWPMLSWRPSPASTTSLLDKLSNNFFWYFRRTQQKESGDVVGGSNRLAHDKPKYPCDGIPKAPFGWKHERTTLQSSRANFLKGTFLGGLAGSSRCIFHHILSTVS